MLQNISGVPIPNARSDLLVSENTTVILNASASRDPDANIRSCLWEQTSGPHTTFSSYSDVMPSFVAPNVNNTADLTFKLTVVDDQNQNVSDTMIVRVENSCKILLDCIIPADLEQKMTETDIVPVQLRREEIPRDLDYTRITRTHHTEIDEISKRLV